MNAISIEREQQPSPPEVVLEPGILIRDPDAPKTGLAKKAAVSTPS